MNKIFQFILQRPVLVMACIVAIFFAAASGLKNFKLDASSDALVIEGDEAFKVYRETGEIFGNSDFLHDVPFDPYLPYLFQGEEICAFRARRQRV